MRTEYMENRIYEAISSAISKGVQYGIEAYKIYTVDEDEVDMEEVKERVIVQMENDEDAIQEEVESLIHDLTDDIIEEIVQELREEEESEE